MANVNSYSYQVPEEREFGFAQALEVGNTIYVSGQLSIDEQGNLLYPDDFEAQLKQLYANFDKVLDHFDATRAQVVSETQYVVNLPEHRAAMANANRATSVATARPAPRSACIRWSSPASSSRSPLSSTPAFTRWSDSIEAAYFGAGEVDRLVTSVAYSSFSFG